MALTGRQKAALLLMSLDEMAAAELLKGLGTEGIQSITMEIAQLSVSRESNSKHQEEVAQEFYESLQGEGSQIFNTDRFLNEMLAKKVVSKEEAENMQAKIKKSNAKKELFKELFAEIHSASTEELVFALDGAHPQTIVVALSELPPKKTQEVLSLLNEDTRLKTICRMTRPDTLGSNVKKRMILSVSEKLKSLEGETLSETPEQHKENLRKTAIMLSSMEKDMRDQLLEEISNNNEKTGSTVRALMVTWEDITAIEDRSLQETLRIVDSKTLAVAIYKADKEIVEKIRKNISERAMTSLDEEASLMQEPLEKEIIDAREEVVAPLRNANEEGTLRMTGR
ncbi:MAG: hypothetical protein FVQ79_10770 [Planctomycetes bacterium]|nr:hypothetical protein [Planctomycetota bacterium]